MRCLEVSVSCRGGLPGRTPIEEAAGGEFASRTLWDYTVLRKSRSVSFSERASIFRTMALRLR